MMAEIKVVALVTLTDTATIFVHPDNDRLVVSHIIFVISRSLPIKPFVLT
jgi:hypothetical protein